MAPQVKNDGADSCKFTLKNAKFVHKEYIVDVCREMEVQLELGWHLIPSSLSTVGNNGSVVHNETEY